MSVYLHDTYASFGRRLAAFILDSVLISIVTLGVRIAFGASPFLSVIPPQSVLHYLVARLFLPYVTGLVVLVGCWVVTRGQSPGKWLMRIRIVKEGNKEIDAKSAVIRYIGYSISSLFASVGFLWMLIDPDRQTFHDKLAKTYVIVDKDARPPFIAYLVALLLPVVSLALYFWFLLVSHGLVVTPGDLRARYKDYEINYNVTKLRPDVKAHWDKAEEYLGQLKGLNVFDPADAKTARPIARQAVEELKLARDLDPHNPLIYAKLSNAYSWLDGDPAAEKAYDNAMTAYRLDPVNSHYAYNAGVALIRLGRYEEAVVMLERAVSLDHTNARAYQSLGVAYQNLHQNTLAIKNYQKAIEFYGKENSDGRLTKAIESLHQAITELSK